MWYLPQPGEKLPRAVGEAIGSKDTLSQVRQCLQKQVRSIDEIFKEHIADNTMTTDEEEEEILPGITRRKQYKTSICKNMYEGLRTCAMGA